MTIGGAVGRGVLSALVVIQVALGLRVAVRMARTARGARIPRIRDGADAASGESGTVSMIVPVLNEAARLGPCLDGLARSGGEVREILVVDGGSTDGTAAIVRAVADRAPRVRLVAAGAAPAGWNGKVHNLVAGAERAAAGSRWLLTIDADVRPEPGLAAALVAFAERSAITALSVATRQRLSGWSEALLHPALLTTLVYRFGIPGSATSRVSEVQANGQCFLVRRDVLARVGGFAPLRQSLCEDVTLARRLAAAGNRVGFYESEGLVSVEMYAGWRDAWRNWTRSLPMRDRYFGVAGWLGLAEVALVQAAPPPLALAIGAWLRWSRSGWPPLRMLVGVNAVLAMMRLGVLVGTARAYEEAPASYWLSPMCDVPATVGVWWSALRRRHEWRGRVMIRGVSGGSA